MADAVWVPPGKQTFLGTDGKVLALGSVSHYIPGTLTPKLTYADEAKLVSNPTTIGLDAAGQCTVWGDGLYRQIVKDENGVQVWDQVTGFNGQSGGGGGGGGKVITVNAPYTVQNADNGATLAIGGGLDILVTFQAASAYDDGFTVLLVNMDDLVSKSVLINSVTTPLGGGSSVGVFKVLGTLRFNNQAPWYPNIEPASGNNQGSGQPNRHQLVWTDTNPTFWANVLNITSVDPSSLCVLTPTGVPANGTLTLTYTFAATPHVVTIPVTAGQTLAQIVTNIIDAIKAVPALYTQPDGGYDSGALISFITNGIASSEYVAYDADIRKAATVSYSAGTTGLTITFEVGQNVDGVTYPLSTKLDNNPVIEMFRDPGFAADSGTIAGFQFGSSQSNSPTVLSVAYGALTCDILSSVSGSLLGRIGLFTTNAAGALDHGVYVAGGFYDTAASDPGTGNINFLRYYVEYGGSAHDIRKLAPIGNPAAVNNAAGTTLTGAQLVGAVIQRAGPGGDFTDTTDTAANIVAAAVDPQHDSLFWLMLVNGSGHQWTIQPGAGVTVQGRAVGGNIVIASGDVRMALVDITNVGTPAVSIFN